MVTLVTGGCGFVGRHVVLRLLTLGHYVWIIDDLSTGKELNLWLPNRYLGQVTFFHEDVRDFLRTNFHPFDYACHLAAVIGGRARVEEDPMAVAQNISIDTDFFFWATKARPKRILYASSSAAYPNMLQGTLRVIALREEHIKFEKWIGQPDTTYGWAKLTGEYLAQLAVKDYGLSVVCVRPFGGYGEDQDDTYPIPAIARRVANKEDPLFVWGTGEQGRDFVHIEDCVDLMLLAIEKIDDGSAINIGWGKRISFHEVAKIFAQIANYDPKIVPLTNKPMGMYSRYADITRAKSLGWQPKISIEEGFKRVYEAKLHGE